MNFDKIAKVIFKAQKIALFSHTRPDGDTIGGVLALKNALQSIGKHCDAFCDNNIPEKFETLNSVDTYNVLEKVYAFPEVVENAALKELPHLVTSYVYELANIFHTYYSKNRILTDNEQETMENILLIKGIRQTIYNALNLIGVIPPEKM